MSTSTSSRRMVVLRALNQTQCISSIQAEVRVLAAKTIYETALKPTDGITDLASAVAAIADLLPQATTFADRLPQEYSDIIKECVLFMTPRDKPQQANNTTAQATNNTIVVESAAERELRDKYVVVGGMRLWRNAEAPWSIFYAHMWIGKRFHEWKSAWDNFTAGSTAPDTIIHRQKCTERIVELWFEETATTTRAEDLSARQTRLFQTAIELLAEGYLVRRGVGIQGNVSTATVHLAASLERRKHDQKPYDFYTDLMEAKAAKNTFSRQ